VISDFAKQISEIKIGKREPVLMVGDIDVTRDFTDVRDVVRAYRMLLNDGKNGEIYNVCSGKMAVDMTIRHPFTGVGQGNYGLLLPKDLQVVETPHNMFLQISAEMGLIGLAAFLWLLYAYYKSSLRLVRTASNDEERVIRAGIIGSVTAVLASGLFGWPFSHGVQEILILSMALSTAEWGIARKAEGERVGVSRSQVLKFPTS
jgi:hypothetical protein